MKRVPEFLLICRMPPTLGPALISLAHGLLAIKSQTRPTVTDRRRDRKASLSLRRVCGL
jgi:hypothetical protein